MMWTGGLTLALIAALSVAGVLYFGKGSKTLSLSKRFVIPTEDLKAGFAIAPVISPSGRFIVYLANNHLWLRDLTKLDAEIIAEMSSTTSFESGVAEGFFWSPDSRAIAFCQNKRMWKYDIETGSKIPLCDVPETGDIIAGAWNKAGDLIIAVWRGGLYRVSDRGGAPNLLMAIDSLKYHDFHSPTFLPDGQTLVLFVHAYNPEDDCIAILKKGATALTRLMLVPRAGGVTYSPTGHLLYTFVDVNPSIWAVPFSAEKLELTGKPFLAVQGGQFPSLSEDGAMIYSVGMIEQELQMTRLSLDGSSVTPIGKPIAGWAAPVFTPDGEHITFTATDDTRRNLWQYDVRRGTLTRLTSDSSVDVLATWVPSRKEYAFNRILSVGKGFVLMLDPTTGRVTDTLVEGLDLALSPDGHNMTYNTDVRGRITIWRLDLNDPAHPEILLNAEQGVGLGGGVSPVAPNGRWFAYASSESGIRQVYVKRFLEPSEAIQVSIDGGNLPFWHPSGKFLFYVTDTALMQVDIVWDDTPKLSQPKMLVNTSDHHLVLTNHQHRDNAAISISPDGSYFIVGRAVGEISGQRLFYVDHWLSETTPER